MISKGSVLITGSELAEASQEISKQTTWRRVEPRSTGPELVLGSVIGASKIIPINGLERVQNKKLWVVTNKYFHVKTFLEKPSRKRWSELLH